MKSYKEFLSESVNIAGDFNGTLHVHSDGKTAEPVGETYSADIIYNGQLFRIEVLSETGIPDYGELNWMLQEDYPGAMVQQIYPPNKPKVNITNSHKINIDSSAHKYGAF
jgi:hypothetical protein